MSLADRRRVLAVIVALALWCLCSAVLTWHTRVTVAQLVGCDASEVWTSSLRPHVWWGPTLSRPTYFLITDGADQVAGTVVFSRGEPWVLRLRWPYVDVGNVHTADEAAQAARAFVGKYWSVPAPEARRVPRDLKHGFAFDVRSAAITGRYWDVSVLGGTEPSVLTFMHATSPDGTDAG